MKEPIDIERSIMKRYRKEIWAPFLKANRDYELFQAGDHVCACISGGKDSMLMAKCFWILQKYFDTGIEVKYLVMDPGYKEAHLDQIKTNAQQLQLDITIQESPIFTSLDHVGKNACYVCARMRRGYLYSYAKELGCNKIALGHHFDDAIETFLMSILYNGQVQAMMPKLHADNYEGMELIRPLYLVKEKAIINWAKANELTFLKCACQFTEIIEAEKDEVFKTSKRMEIKQLIKEYRKQNPKADENIFHAMGNVNLDKILGYYSDEGSYNFLDDYDEKKGDPSRHKKAR